MNKANQLMLVFLRCALLSGGLTHSHRQIIRVFISQEKLLVLLIKFEKFDSQLNLFLFIRIELTLFECCLKF